MTTVANFSDPLPPVRYARTHRRKLGGVDLIDEQPPLIPEGFQVDAHAPRATKQQANSSSNTNMAAFSPRRTRRL